MIKWTERPDSRDLHYGSQGAGQTLRFNAFPTAGESEQEIWLFALSQTTPTFNGFIRQDIKVTPKEWPQYLVEVEYGTTGVGGGDQPLGGNNNDGSGPDQPTAPESGSVKIASGYSFSVTAPKLRIMQSRRTVSGTKRGGGVAKDFKGAINVDKDGKVEGCETPPDAAFIWKRTVGVASITMGYLQILAALAGRPNDAPFYTWDTCESLFLGADGQFTQGDGWSITYSFGVQENEVNIDICPGLQVPAKKGWEYLWVYYEEAQDPLTSLIVTVPGAAYVEEIMRPAPFGLLAIGE